MIFCYNTQVVVESEGCFISEHQYDLDMKFVRKRTPASGELWQKERKNPGFSDRLLGRFSLRPNKNEPAAICCL